MASRRANPARLARKYPRDTLDGIRARFHSDGQLAELAYVVNGSPCLQLDLDGHGNGVGTTYQGSGGTADWETYSEGCLEVFDAWSDNSKPYRYDLQTWITEWVEAIEAASARRSRQHSAVKAVLADDMEALSATATSSNALDRALPAAIESGRTEMARLLVDRGARVRTRKVARALLLAADKGHWETVVFMVDHGAPTGQAGEDGVTLAARLPPRGA